MEELKIIITADDQATGKVSGLNKALGGLGSLASGALKVGLGVAVGGVAALGAGLVTSTLAAMEAENIQADLVATLLSTKGVSGMTADSINALASAFQNTTRFEDDTIVKGQSMLLTFTNIGKDVFPMATEAMLNMGQKFGSLDAAALQLGKALNDPIAGVGALRRVGVQLTDAQELQIKSLMALGDVQGAQKIILGELQIEFGGLAVAAGQTFAGKLDILKNKFGDVQEKIGGAMLPALTKLGEKLIEVLDKPEVKAAIEAITNWLADALPKAIDTGMGLLNTLQKDGITGVLKQAQVWVNDPTTQAALKQVGSLFGQGLVDGIRLIVTSAPTWVAISKEVGKALAPVGAAMAHGIMIGLMSGLTGQDLSKSGFTIGVGGVGIGVKGLGFQSGGVVPGPMGMPQLAVVHGGETITPAGGGGGGGMTFVYAPAFSLADAREFETKLRPVLDQWYQGARRRRV